MSISELNETAQKWSNLSNNGKIIVFTCNWRAYNGLETACRNQNIFPPNVFPIRVNCIGQLSSGTLLKTFEKGAQGVLLLGCPPGECHYNFGNDRAQEVIHEVKKIISLLGYDTGQIKLDWASAGDGDIFIQRIYDFLKTLSLDQDR